MKMYNIFRIFLLGALAVNLTSCATTGFKFRQPGVEELKYKKITQVDPSFWKGIDSVHISSQSHLLGVTGIDAAIGGDIDIGGTCSSVIKSAVPAVILGGFNPIGGAVMLVQMAAEGPQRKADASFKDDVNVIVGSYDWDAYFAEVLRNRFGTIVKADISSLNDKNLIPDKRTDLFMRPNRRNIMYSLHVDLKGGISSQGWMTPDAALSGTTVALVVTDEVMQEVLESKANGKTTEFFTSFLSYNIIFQQPSPQRVSSTLSRLTTYNRAYKIDIFKKTRSYDKKTWLSDNGAFLQKQLKTMLEELAGGLVETSC
jgi:hypothetical protein